MVKDLMDRAIDSLEEKNEPCPYCNAFGVEIFDVPIPEGMKVDRAIKLGDKICGKCQGTGHFKRWPLEL